MDAIELLHKRVSCPVLCEPAPSAEQLEVMYQAAARAPDHGCLRPWRLLLVEGDKRTQLGELFLSAAQAEGEVDEAKRKKLLNMPMRAPLLMLVIAKLQQHPKVPEMEQLITAGCAAHAIELAAHAQGLGAMWRSGDMMFNSHVAEGLGLSENERLVGFLYLGSRRAVREVQPVDSQAFATYW